MTCTTKPAYKNFWVRIKTPTSEKVTAFVEGMKNKKPVKNIGLQVAEIKLTDRESILHHILYVQGKDSNTKICHKTISDFVARVDPAGEVITSFGLIENFPRFPVYSNLHGTVERGIVGVEVSTPRMIIF